jgi:hypothetical protein
LWPGLVVKAVHVAGLKVSSSGALTGDCKLST